MYELRNERNKLFWSYFHISSIMRPVCFVVTPEKQDIFTHWCHDFSNAFQYKAANIQFWCFPFSYCDRSNWKTVSDDIKYYFTLLDSDKEYIQQVPLNNSGEDSSNYDSNSDESDDMSI
jgi:hypothetical protein